MNTEPPSENKELAEVLAPFMNCQIVTPQMLAACMQCLFRVFGKMSAPPKTTPQEEPLLTATELCTQMDISKSTLANWRKCPNFPTVPLHGRGKKRPIVKFRRADVDAWNQEQNRIRQELAK